MPSGIITALLWQAERVAIRQRTSSGSNPHPYHPQGRKLDKKYIFKEDYYLRKRSISIPIRVTKKELTTIETKATNAGMNRTDYLIACAMGKRITVINDLTPLTR